MMKNKIKKKLRKVAIFIIKVILASLILKIIPPALITIVSVVFGVLFLAGVIYILLVH